MSYEKDGITYPTKFHEAIKDKRINKLFLQYMADRSQLENYKFLTIDIDPEIHYRTFIAENAKSPINVSSAIRAPMIKLAKSNNWDKAAWKPLIDSAKAAITLLIEANCLGSSHFYASKRFLQTHMDRVRQARGTPKIPDRQIVALAKLLGYNQPKDILTDLYIEDRVALEQIAFYTRNKQADKAGNLIADMKQRAKLRNQGAEINEDFSTPESVLAATDMMARMKAEAAKEDAEQPRDANDQSPTGVVIDIDRKRLDRLDWDLATDPKSIGMLNETIQFYIDGDKNEAKQIFEKLKKRQPRTSTIHAGSVKALVLALKKAKLIEAVRA